MNRLELILSAILTVSIILNIGLMIYARVVVVQLLSIADELADLQKMIDAFASHLKAVYELDSFYGDETLRGLLEHAISFNEQMDTFDYVVSLTTEDSLNDTQQEELPHENNTEEEEN
tara:strand:+ start:1211 stop:1564 length:354 start_codon:yes stop_codon:yes gene_type:complete